MSGSQAVSLRSVVKGEEGSNGHERGGEVGGTIHTLLFSLDCLLNRHVNSEVGAGLLGPSELLIHIVQPGSGAELGILFVLDHNLRSITCIQSSHEAGTNAGDVFLLPSS